MRTNLEAIAYHEAGHLVARFDLGLPVSSATIIPKDDTLGQVTYRNLPRAIYDAVEFSSPTPAQWQRIESELVSTLAGPDAEERFRGRRNRAGASQDFEWVAEWTIRLHGNERVAECWLRYLEALAESLIDRRWVNVEAVAQLLLAERKVGRSRLREAYKYAGWPADRIARDKAIEKDFRENPPPGLVQRREEQGASRG